MSKAHHVGTRAANRLRAVRDHHEKTSRKWFEGTMQHATDYLEIAAETLEGGASAKGLVSGAMALSVEAMATATSFYHDLYGYCRAVTSDVPGTPTPCPAQLFFELDASATVSQPRVVPGVAVGDEGDLVSSDLVATAGVKPLPGTHVKFTAMNSDVLVTLRKLSGALQAGNVYVGQITRKSSGAFVSTITVLVTK